MGMPSCSSKYRFISRDTPRASLNDDTVFICFLHALSCPAPYFIYTQEQPRAGSGFDTGICPVEWNARTNAMVYAVTRAYHEENRKDFFKGVLVSISLTLLVFLIAAVAIFAIAIIPLVLALFPLSAWVESLCQLASLAGYCRPCFILHGDVLPHSAFPPGGENTLDHAGGSICSGAVARRLLRIFGLCGEFWQL